LCGEKSKKDSKGKQFADSIQFVATTVGNEYENFPPTGIAILNINCFSVHRENVH
jgi:hypothetical protein